MEEKKIVVHMVGGTIHKGITLDFEPDRSEFHLLPAEGGGVPVRIRVGEMKALFYVKDWLGNRDFVARRSFDTIREQGRKAILTFRDGETMWGTVGQGEESDQGFFFYPVDEQDNNDRIFVVRDSLEEIRWVP
jgi:hypothetical protein